MKKEAFAAHDLDKTISYYSSKAWKDLSDTPGLSLTWKVTRVEASASGEMAYVSGTYNMTIKGANGAADANDHGKYLDIWEKKNGTCKCGADIWNSDLPVPAPAEKK